MTLVQIHMGQLLPCYSDHMESQNHGRVGIRNMVETTGQFSGSMWSVCGRVSDIGSLYNPWKSKTIMLKICYSVKTL